MDLGNMRKLGVQRLLVSCLNPECLHSSPLDVSAWPDATTVPSFHRRMVCSRCGARGSHIDLRPNWKEQPARPSLTGKQ
jgi:hypothetical protein